MLVVVHILAVWRAFLVVVVHMLAVRGPHHQSLAGIASLLYRFALLLPLCPAQTCPASLEQTFSLQG